MRQKARKEGLRRLAPQKLIANIQKFNRIECQEGGLGDRAEVRRKNLMSALKDVLQKQKETEINTRKQKEISISGMNKILGRIDTETEKELTKEIRGEEIETTVAINASLLSEKSRIIERKKEDKENKPLYEDLEFPPGIPRPVHLCPPPGIRPRPQVMAATPNPRSSNSVLKNKTNQKSSRNFAKNFEQPTVEVLHPRAQERQKRQNRRDAENMFDPMNPENPFFLQHPRQQKQLKQKADQIMRIERRKQKQLEQQQNTIGPSAQNDVIGPLPPGPSEQDDLPALPEPGPSGEGKLEILLPDEMVGLVPTSVRIKRQRQKIGKRRQHLELAPEVGTSTKERKRKAKNRRKVNSEYDAFINEIEGLM